VCCGGWGLAGLFWGKGGWGEIPDVDLPVGENAPGGFLVEGVHPGFCAVFLSETAEEEGALVGAEEFGCLGPVDDEEFADYGDDDCEEAFDDEDPSPAVVASDSGHVRERVCE